MQRQKLFLTRGSFVGCLEKEQKERRRREEEDQGFLEGIFAFVGLPGKRRKEKWLQ